MSTQQNSKEPIGPAFNNTYHTYVSTKKLHRLYSALMDAQLSFDPEMKTQWAKAYEDVFKDAAEILWE